VHVTPTGASQLNLVECWSAVPPARKLRHGVRRSVRELNANTCDLMTLWTRDPRHFVWTKTSDRTLQTIVGYCDRIADSGH
jgi:hypothetical protein